MAPKAIDISGTDATTKDSTIDADKINGLMANLDRRLAGGLHGEFFELGSKRDADNRHNQLDMVFGLRKELADLKVGLDKQANQASLEADPRGKKVAPLNTNMITTIKTIVQDQLTAPLRDLALTNERLEQRLKKAEDEIEGYKAKIKAQDVKIKKANERTPQISDGPTDIRHRLEELQRDLFDMQGRLEGPDSTIEWAVTAIMCLQSELRDRVKRIDKRREADQARAEQQYADLDAKQEWTPWRTVCGGLVFLNEGRTVEE